jgi:indolepyruvate ferredoxin oxidoreductase
MAIIEAKERALAAPHLTSPWCTPTFCSGCPHNTSTHVPEGSRAVAGIGCHYMATWMPERRTETFTQMGGEGVPWIGQAPFTDEKHVFANLGDGTYFHSGIAGDPRRDRGRRQHHLQDPLQRRGRDDRRPADRRHADGAAHRRADDAEGASEIVVVTDEPHKYDALKTRFRDGRRRDPPPRPPRLGAARLREVPGCTILIYDQTCASEKRRRRKKIVDGKPGYPDPRGAW